MIYWGTWQTRGIRWVTKLTEGISGYWWLIECFQSLSFDSRKTHDNLSNKLIVIFTEAFDQITPITLVLTRNSQPHHPCLRPWMFTGDKRQLTQFIHFARWTIQNPKGEKMGSLSFTQPPSHSIYINQSYLDTVNAVRKMRPCHIYGQWAILQWTRVLATTFFLTLKLLDCTKRA